MGLGHGSGLKVSVPLPIFWSGISQPSWIGLCSAVHLDLGEEQPICHSLKPPQKPQTTFEYRGVHALPGMVRPKEEGQMEQIISIPVYYKMVLCKFVVHEPVTSGKFN